MKTVPALRQSTHVKHPFAACFHELGKHTPSEALDALSKAVQADKNGGMNAYDWAQQALPGASLLPGYAVGTVEELQRSYSRDQEFRRFVSVIDEY